MHILGVADQGLSGLSSFQVPESDGAVPRGGKAESAVLGEVEVRDEMRVSGENSSWHAPLLLLVGLGSLGQVPDDESVISGARDEELLIGFLLDFLLADLHAGDPAVVALEVASVVELVGWL